METSSIIVNGTIVSHKHAIDKITGFHTYLVTINFDSSIITDDKEEVTASSSGRPNKTTPSTSTTKDSTKLFNSLLYGVKEIYKLTEVGIIVPLHVILQTL